MPLVARCNKKTLCISFCRMVIHIDYTGDVNQADILLLGLSCPTGFHITYGSFLDTAFYKKEKQVNYIYPKSKNVGGNRWFLTQKFTEKVDDKCLVKHEFG